MKNPNGYGCIKHLSGSRRNPWAFVVTEGGKQKVKGYFPSKLEALAFQVDWNKPHDTRHTCATLLDGAEVNDNARKMILGHARGDVTNGVYTHKTLRQLRKAIECL